MTTERKIELNKKIRSYNGSNNFLLSLKKSLNGKYCQKVKVGNKTYKILSDKQYEAALTNKEISE